MRSEIKAVCNFLFRFLSLALIPLLLSACFFNANINSMDQGKFISNQPSQNAEVLAPVKLVFVKQPVGHVAPLALFSQQPAIELQDSTGNKIVSGPIATAKINLSLSSGTGVLSGTLSASATAGRLDFSDLMLDQEGVDKKITATLDLSVPEIGALVSAPVSVTSDAFIISSVAAPTDVYSYYARSLSTSPTVTVEGLANGDQVLLYSDNCQTQIASMVASSSSENFYLNNLSPGSYSFHAKRIVGGKPSPCSFVAFNYLIPDTVTVASSQFMNRIMEGIGVKSVDIILSRAQSTDTTVYYSHSGSTATTTQVSRTDGAIIIPAGSLSASLTYIINSDVSVTGETKLLINLEGTDTDKVAVGLKNQALILIKDAQASSKIAVSLTSGSDHACIIDSNQKVYCWGYNFFGQVGVGSLYNLFRTPQLVTAGTSYSYIEANNIRTCAISISGALYCWGSNTSAPGLVDSGTSYKMVSPGIGVTCGITSTDALKCWGSNSSGQVGNGTTTNQALPIVIDPGVSYKYINAGGSYGSVCGITLAGVLKCWGSNASGILGDGTNVDSLSPKIIDSGILYTKVAVGMGLSCGIDTSSKVRCWGSGYIGSGSYADKSVPVIVDGSESYQDIAVQKSICGLTTLGKIKCWGVNNSGELGIGDTTSSSTPLQISSAESFSKVTMGNNFACGIATTGSIVCWGSNAYGQFGTGSAFKNRLPVLLNVSESVKSVSSGGMNTCYINANDQIKCMAVTSGGGAISGEGLNVDRSSYVRVDPLQGYKQIAMSYNGYSSNACAITTGDDLKCWGNNYVGQLGQGQTDPYGHLMPESADFGTKYQKVSIGSGTICGITSSQQLKCWGQNYAGEVGNGNTLAQPTPYVVDSGVNYIDVSAGTFFTCGVTSANVLKCWGSNNSYQLGVGNTTDSSVPIVVDSGVAYSKVVASQISACAITTAGRVKCWGNNSDGRLGDGSGTTRTTPVFINDSSAYIDLSTGGDFNCGVTDANVLKCWGRNFDAQLGNGNASDQSSPVVIDSGVLYDRVSASSVATCARQLVNQKYKCWGTDPLGNLGLQHPLKMYPVNYTLGFEN